MNHSLSWPKLLNDTRNSTIWNNIFPPGRASVLYSQQIDVYTDLWVIRDLRVDLEKDVSNKLTLSTKKPKQIHIFADLVTVPAKLSLTLKNIGLVIVARRIEVEDTASIHLDYSSTLGATLVFYIQEISGTLNAKTIHSTPETQVITAPEQAGFMVKFDAINEKVKVLPITKFDKKGFDKNSSLWNMAVSSFQMATALVIPSRIETDDETLNSAEAQEKRQKAVEILGFVIHCAKDAPDEGAAEWHSLASNCQSFINTLNSQPFLTRNVEWAYECARLLNLNTPVKELQRRIDEVKRKNTLYNQAPPYALIQVNTPPPEPGSRQYIRHGAQTLGLAVLNGWNQPVRSVTLYGVEIELDQGDSSGFIASYSGKADIQTLSIHADTLVIKTRLHFPATQVFITCRELIFEGENACIDTQPLPSPYRASLDKNGADGECAGDIHLNIQCFRTTEPATVKHFKLIGGKGQNPDEGAIEISHSLKHLPKLTKDDWSSLFNFNNRSVGISDVLTQPAWSDYKEYHSPSSQEIDIGIIYIELKINGTIVDFKGVKDSPGKGGKGPLPGRPGIGGAGGTLFSTHDSVIPYSDVSGGLSGEAILSTKGGVGGTPDIAYWFLFENKKVDEKMQLVPTIEEKRAEVGEDGGAGPLAYEPKGKEGKCEKVSPSNDSLSSWLSPINLKCVLQYAKDTLASGHPSLTREALMAYLDGLENPYNDETLVQLHNEAVTLVEQATQNVDFYGNPPGWVPMLALNTAVELYQKILPASMQEIYTAYYIQKAWQGKTDRLQALQSLVDVIDNNTKTTQKKLLATRKELIVTAQELIQLTTTIEQAIKKFDKREKDLKQHADFATASQFQQEIIATAFKIAGAIAKAIPLPEPYQMAAGAFGTVLDISGEFIKGGEDTNAAFTSLKTGVKGYLEKNEGNFIKESEKKLDSSLEPIKDDIKQLQNKAGLATAEKEKLQDDYDTKTKAHKTLLEKENAVLEAEREKLLYGRGSKRKERVNLLDEDFKKYEEKLEEKHALSIKEYNDQKKIVTGFEKGIKTKEEELKKSKEAVETKKKANTLIIKDGIKQVQNIAEGIETVGKAVNSLLASKTQLNSLWDKTLAKLEIGDEIFKSITRELENLEKIKTALATKLLNQKTSLSQQRNLITNNLLTVNLLSSQVASSKDALDPMVTTYVQSVSQEAHQQLMRFLYYVIKAYEYYMVEPWNATSQGSLKLFDNLCNVLEPQEQLTDLDLSQDQQTKLKTLLSSPAAFKKNVLTQEEFNLLKIVYEKPLLDMGRYLYDQLSSGAKGLLMESKITVTLRDAQLKVLNDKIKDNEESVDMPFSLLQLQQIDLNKQKQRIVNIKVIGVNYKRLGNYPPDTISFKFIHEGKSLVLSQGKLFAFEPEGGGEETKGQRASVIFETFSENSGKSQDGIIESKDLKQASVEPQANLLSSLLSKDKEDAKKVFTLSAFHPGIFSDFKLCVFGAKQIELTEILLEVTIEAAQAPSQLTICVNTEPELSIPIQANAIDKNGYAGALGQYIGLFDTTCAPVGFTVPKVYGQYKHVGWRVDDIKVINNGENYYELKKSAYLTATYKPV